MSIKKKRFQGSGRPKSYLVTALLASAAVAYALFVFVPAQKKIVELRSTLNERRQHILQANSLVLPLDQASGQLAKTKLVTLEWQKEAPRPSTLAGHFARLSSEAEAAGVTIEKFDPQPAVEMKVLAQHAVVIQWKGDFAQSFDFIRRIEQLPGTVWLRQLRMTRSEQPRSPLQGELTLTIFVDRSDYAD